MSLLIAKNLSKSYGKKPIIRDLSFTIHPGEIVGLLGPNGAGKTTAFYLTMGLTPPDSGDIFFKNQSIASLPIDKRALLGMGYLAQEPSIFRGLTVKQNILAILETLNLPKQEEEERLSALLEELHLTKLSNKNASTLSGGERRRLEITRALIREPSILLLDEPFANIDPLAIEDVQNLIFHLKNRGISIFITDHNAREIFSIVDRCYLMQDGMMSAEGSVDELIHDTNVRRHYLGENFRL